MVFAGPVPFFAPRTGASVETVTRFAPARSRVPAGVVLEYALGRDTQGFALVQPVTPNTAFFQDVAELLGNPATVCLSLPDL